MGVLPPVSRLDVNLSVIVNAVKLNCVRINNIAVVLPDVSPQIVFSVISAVTYWARPDLSFGVLGVNVSLKPLFVVKCLVAMNALVISQVLMSISHVSVENLD